MGERGGSLHPVAVRIVAVAIVQQHDRARRNAFERPPNDLVDSGAIAVPDAE
jgi:hypothetical protein